MTAVPDLEVVAIRTAGPHAHIIRVRLADGQEQGADQVIAAIAAHEAHYVMQSPDHDHPLLVRVQQCPDCLEDVLWA